MDCRSARRSRNLKHLIGDTLLTFLVLTVAGAPPWLIGWLDAVSLWQAVLVIAAIVGVIVFIRSKGWRWMLAFARAILATAEVIDHVKELPAFIARTDERHAALADQVQTIHHQLNPNGGTSMNDSVRRVEETTERLELGVRGLYDRVADLAATDDRLAAADEQLRKDLENTHPQPKDTP